jgi:hypothetical protein
MLCAVASRGNDQNRAPGVLGHLVGHAPFEQLSRDAERWNIGDSADRLRLSAAQPLVDDQTTVGELS